MTRLLLSTLLTAGLLSAPHFGFADDDDKQERQEQKERAKAEKELRKEQRKAYGNEANREKYSPYRAYGGQDDNWDGTRHHHSGPSTSRGQSEWNREQHGRNYTPEYKSGDRTDWNKSGRDLPAAQQRSRERELGRRDTAAAFSRPLANTSKVEFSQLPHVVRQTVRQQAGDAKIEDVDRGTLDGRTVYEVAFKKGGVHNELRVYENGDVLRRVAGNNIQFPSKQF